MAFRGTHSRGEAGTAQTHRTSQQSRVRSPNKKARKRRQQASKAINFLCKAKSVQCTAKMFEEKTESLSVFLRSELWHQHGQKQATVYASFICVVAVLVAAVVVLGGGRGTVHVHRRAAYSSMANGCPPPPHRPRRVLLSCPVLSHGPNPVLPCHNAPKLVLHYSGNCVRDE